MTGMDLHVYERKKFELADLLRAAIAMLPKDWEHLREPLRELLVRLAEDRFNLVVVGRYSRGKTSVMNAILGMDRLPTGILPVTSVITTVHYGSRERVFIHYQQRGIPIEIGLDALPEYVTQQGNSANTRKLASAEVQLPAEVLRRGFVFVDTPGLGSPIVENTATTESFLPEADALLLVTGYDGPLSEDELRITTDPRYSNRRTFIVVNKADTVSKEERLDALAFVRERLSKARTGDVPRIFSLSAHMAMGAKLRRDDASLRESGIVEFEQELVRFLIADKSTEILLRTCDRLTELLYAIPKTSETIALLKRIKKFSAETAGEGAPPESGCIT